MSMPGRPQHSTTFVQQETQRYKIDLQISPSSSISQCGNLWTYEHRPSPHTCQVSLHLQPQGPLQVHPRYMSHVLQCIQQYANIPPACGPTYSQTKATLLLQACGPTPRPSDFTTSVFDPIPRPSNLILCHTVSFPHPATYSHVSFPDQVALTLQCMVPLLALIHTS